MYLNRIIENYCQITGYTIEQLSDSNNNKNKWYARYFIWHYLHCDKKISIGNIAKLFNRSRASVFRGIRLLKHQMYYDKGIRTRYEKLKKQLEDIVNPPIEQPS